MREVGAPTEAGVAEPQEKSSEEKEETAITEEPRIVITTNHGGKTIKENKLAITVKCSNGLNITRKGMSYQEFLTFAQKLEALC